MFRFLPFNNGYGAGGGSLFGQGMAGFSSWSGTATQDLTPYRMILVSRARQLAIMAPMAAAGVKRVMGGIIGEGLKYAPGNGSGLLDGYLDIAGYVERRFKMASHLHSLDAQGRMTWPMMQEMACYNWLLTGEVFFVRKPAVDGISSWRIIEADRCVTPCYMASEDPLSMSRMNPETGCRIIDGIELDGYGKAVAYWILRDYIDNPLLVCESQIERIPAMGPDGLPLVLHLYKAERPDQYRGVPLIGEVIQTIFSTQNFIQATEQAAQFEAALYGFIKSDNPAIDETDTLDSRYLDEKIPLAPKPGGQDGQAQDGTGAGTGADAMPRLDEGGGTDSGGSDPVMTLDPSYIQDTYAQAMYDKMYPRAKTVSAGQIIHLGENEDIKFLQPQHPNGNFESYIKSQWGQVASAIGIPKQALMCEFDTTYASAKAAVIQANETYKRFRGYFLEAFIKPVFQVFAYDAVKGFVDDPLYVSVAMAIDSIWEAPAMMCLDELKELQAWKMAIDMGLVTRDEAAQALYSHRATGTPETPDRSVDVDKY